MIFLPHSQINLWERKITSFFEYAFSLVIFEGSPQYHQLNKNLLTVATQKKSENPFSGENFFENTFRKRIFFRH